MKHNIPVEQLLRWRLKRAEAEAPPSPRAAQLLKLARPSVKTSSEQTQSEGPKGPGANGVHPPRSGT